MTQMGANTRALRISAWLAGVYFVIELVPAIGGIITEVISLRLQYAGQKGDLNIKGAFWHIIQTFVGGILIIVTALVIELTGFLAVDPILGIAFGVVFQARSDIGCRPSFVGLCRTPSQACWKTGIGRIRYRTRPGGVTVTRCLRRSAGAADGPLKQWCNDQRPFHVFIVVMRICGFVPARCEQRKVEA